MTNADQDILTEWLCAYFRCGQAIIIWRSELNVVGVLLQTTDGQLPNGFYLLPELLYTCVTMRTGIRQDYHIGYQGKQHRSTILTSGVLRSWNLFCHLRVLLVLMTHQLQCVAVPIRRFQVNGPEQLL